MPEMTLEQLRLTREYIDLTPRQRVMVEKFLTNEGDKVAAVQSAYRCSSPDTARKNVGRHFARLPVAACLAVYWGVDPERERFEQDVRKMMHDRKTTPSQVALVKLYAALHGFAGLVENEPSSEKVVLDKVLVRDGRRLRTVVTDLGAVEITEEPS